jgi:hypothetical protein
VRLYQEAGDLGCDTLLQITTVRHAACLHNSAHDEFSSFMW